MAIDLGDAMIARVVRGLMNGLGNDPGDLAS
jgi:hypothetical protein